MRKLFFKYFSQQFSTLGLQSFHLEKSDQLKVVLPSDLTSGCQLGSACVAPNRYQMSSSVAMSPIHISFADCMELEIVKALNVDQRTLPKGQQRGLPCWLDALQGADAQICSSKATLLGLLSGDHDLYDFAYMLLAWHALFWRQRQDTFLSSYTYHCGMDSFDG